MIKLMIANLGTCFLEIEMEENHFDVTYENSTTEEEVDKSFNTYEDVVDYVQSISANFDAGEMKTFLAMLSTYNESK